jgi:hypothetical protein
MTTTKDYGAVVGWWCPVCRIKDAAARDATGAVMPMGCCGRRCIPVYEPIPAGQRPEAEEPDEDTVCRYGDSGSGLTTPSCNRWSSRWDREPYTWLLTGEGMSPPAAGPDATNLADAVLWVAAGRLP